MGIDERGIRDDSQARVEFPGDDETHVGVTIARTDARLHCITAARPVRRSATGMGFFRRLVGRCRKLGSPRTTRTVTCTG